MATEADETRDLAGGVAEAEQFLVAFETLAQAVRRARGAAAAELPDRLTLSQYSLLLPLCGNESARITDLAATAGIAPSTASRILDVLERRGIVRRARSPHDRRGVTVSLTQSGLGLLARQDEWMRQRRLQFFGGLPAVEQRVVSDLLVRLAGLIDELNAGPAS